MSEQNTQSAEVSAVIAPEKIGQSLTLNIKTKTDDILAIAVSNHEDILEQQRANLETNIRRLRKKIEDLVKELDKGGKQQIEDTFKADMAALVASLSEWGFTRVTGDFDEVHLNITDKTIKVQCRITAKDTTSNYGYGSTRDTLRADKEVPANGVLCAKIDELTQAQDELKNLLDLHTEVRRALANIDRVERRARAALARKTLEATAEGRTMLAAMNDVSSPFHGLLALTDAGSTKPVTPAA